MAGPASYSSYQNRGKNAGSLDIATQQSVPIFILGTSECGKTSLILTIIGENSVCEKKYGGIIEVCKPTVKVDKFDVTATWMY